MPYIKQEVRSEFAGWLNPLLRFVEERGVTAGELNYLITKLCKATLLGRGSAPGYEEYNELLGVLEGAKMELYRRQIAPFEDQKMVVNGDV